MTTQPQVRTRTRNWNKAQVKCIEAMAKKMLNGKEMYPYEKVTLEQILFDCRTILNDWEPKVPTLT